MKIKFEDTLLNLNIDSEIVEKNFTDQEISKAFGRSVKTLRTYKKMSLNALSDLVDIPNPTINRYENGINIPTLIQALKLADFFGVSIENMIAFGLADESGAMLIEYYEKK